MTDPSSNSSEPVDEDLELALAAFGADLRDVLDEDEDEADWAAMAEASTDDSAVESNPTTNQSTTDLAGSHDAKEEAIDPVEHILEKFGDKLSEESNLAYAGSIALACHTAENYSAKISQRFVVVGIGQQRFALPLSCVTEVVRCGDIEVTALPRTAGWLKGVTCVRGNMLSVTDLSPLFNLPSDESGSDKKMVIIQSQEKNLTTALWVDRIHGIRTLATREALSADPDDPVASIFSGVSELDQQEVLIIDPDQLFGCPQLSTYTT